MTKSLEKVHYFEDSTLPLQVHIRDPQPDFPLHTHGFDELVIILKGTAVHQVDRQIFPVQRGEVFIVSGDHEHQYREQHGLALANILFDSDALGMNQWDTQALPGFHALFALEPVLRTQQKFNARLHLDDRQLEITTEILQELCRETTDRTPGYRMMARGIFMRLVVFLSRCYTDTPADESIDLLRLGDAIAHIETHYTEPITLEDLAQKAHLSKRHFQRIFNECIGRSPIEHLLEIRIRKAKELLRNTEQSITDIAFDCGFQDSNYFTRQFRKISGLTPRQYRKTNKLQALI